MTNIDGQGLKPKCIDGGICLDGSILCLDAISSGQLSFLSSITSFPIKNRLDQNTQFIATEETIRLLESKKKRTNALLCQYNRPFSIGRLRMELLPSGSVLGGASLYIEAGKDRILYAPDPMPHKNATTRQMQLKKAHTLILGALQPDPQSTMPSRKKEKERLVDAVQKSVSENSYPTVFCSELLTAQELCKDFSDAGLSVAVHSSIFRYNKIYEQFGAKLGAYSLFDRRRTKSKVLLFPMPQKGIGPIRANLPVGPIFYVESALAHSYAPSAHLPVDDRFFLSQHADGKELKDIIQAVNPKEVFIFGPYTKQYCAEFKNIHPKVKALFPNGQPQLL